MSRDPAMQAWPWLWKIANAEPLTAASRSASAKTMLAPLPPSSSWTRFTLPADSSTIRRPTAVEPVKAILRRPGGPRGARPSSRPGPGTMLTTPAGIPDLGHQLGDPQGRQRRQLGGLHHDACCRPRGPGPSSSCRTSAGSSRARSAPTDAERLAQDVVEEARLDRDDVALDLVGHAPEVAERGRGARDVEARLSRSGWPVSRLSSAPARRRAPR